MQIVIDDGVSKIEESGLTFLQDGKFASVVSNNTYV